MTGTKTIVGATDFSEGAEHAVRRAALLAGEHGARLTLMHVVNDSIWLNLLPNRADGARRLAAARTRLQRIGGALRREYKARGDNLLLTGQVSREIVGRLNRHPVDLMVVGAHQKQWARELMVGGVALKVLHGARCPVLMVRRLPQSLYRTVLIATDFSDASVHAVRLALELFPTAAHCLLHAYDVFFENGMRLDGVDPQEIARKRRSVEKKAAKALKNFAAECDALAMTRLLLPGNPVVAILDQCQILPADVVLFGKHGGSATGERFFGSITQNVLHHADCDVLVVP